MAVGKTYVASECGERAITRAEAEVEVGITQSRAGEFVYWRARLCGERWIPE